MWILIIILEEIELAKVRMDSQRGHVCVPVNWAEEALLRECLFPTIFSRHCCCVSVLVYCFYYVTRGIPASRNLSQGKCPLRPFSVSPVIAPTVSLVYLCPALLNNCPAPPQSDPGIRSSPGGEGQMSPTPRIP